MYSTLGLREWEVITYSGILAIVALSIATIIGLVMSNLIMHVPGLARREAPAHAKVPMHVEPSVPDHRGLVAGT
jgi:hypothetical protein